MASRSESDLIMIEIKYNIILTDGKRKGFFCDRSGNDCLVKDQVLQFKIFDFGLSKRLLISDAEQDEKNERIAGLKAEDCETTPDCFPREKFPADFRAPEGGTPGMCETGKVSLSS